jgi:hypothetical protein
LVLWAVISTYSLVGLVAVWGAQGRSHWFLRLGAVLAFLAAGLVTTDRRLCLLFLSETVVVILRLWYLQRRAERVKLQPIAASVGSSYEPAGNRFSLGQLLLVFVLLGGLLAILSRLPPQVRWNWYEDVLPGALLGVFTLIAVWAAESKRSPWLRAAILVIVFPALLMGVWLWLARLARGRFGRAMVLGSLILIAILPARIYYAEFKARTFSFPRPLAENGYIDLLRASELVDDPTVNVDTLSDDELLAYLQSRAPALELAKQALDRPCQAMLYESMNDISLALEGQRIHKLSELFAAKGGLESQEGRLDDAVESYLADIELGAAMTNGGVMMHDGFGFVSEQFGVEGLQKLVPRLNDDACRKLAERLQEIDACREPSESSIARERFYYAATYPWKHRANTLARVLFPGEPITYDHLIEMVAGEKRARLRLLVVHLALRRYWLAEKKYPRALGELVPRYLSVAPFDPFADRELRYEKHAAEYLLYSIGDDRVDDAGTPARPFKWPSKGDIVVAVDFQSAADDEPADSSADN